MPPAFDESGDHLRRARGVLERERSRLLPLVPGARLELTGASSVPGSLTSGDVDLHLRVPPDEFTSAVTRLRNELDVVLPEIWSASLATFSVPGDPEVGVAVTPIGSEHDRRFDEAWRALRTDGGLLARYTELKRAHRRSSDVEYRAAKARFFDELAERARYHRAVVATSRSPEVDEYIARQAEPQRRTLEALRERIHELVPGAGEAISYGFPGFSLGGTVVVWIAGWKRHCSIYPVTDALLATHREALAPYLHGSGTLRFPPESPPPPELVEALVRARLTEVGT